VRQWVLRPRRHVRGHSGDPSLSNQSLALVLVNLTRSTKRQNTHTQNNATQKVALVISIKHTQKKPRSTERGQTESGLAAFTTSSQETERVFFQHRAHECRSPHGVMERICPSTKRYFTQTKNKCFSEWIGCWFFSYAF